MWTHAQTFSEVLKSDKSQLSNHGEHKKLVAQSQDVANDFSNTTTATTDWYQQHSPTAPEKSVSRGADSDGSNNPASLAEAKET